MKVKCLIRVDVPESRDWEEKLINHLKEIISSHDKGCCGDKIYIKIGCGE